MTFNSETYLCRPTGTTNEAPFLRSSPLTHPAAPHPEVPGVRLTSLSDEYWVFFFFFFFPLQSSPAVSVALESQLEVLPQQREQKPEPLARDL